MSRLPTALAAAWTFLAVPATTAADPDWPWWRGPDHDGVAAGDGLPILEWGESKNVVWKAHVPGRGHGSPTVIGDRVLLATADHDDETQSVICYDRRTGERRWQTVVHRGGFVKKQNSKASLASCTVASDGERVFVNFLHDGAVYATALDLNGKQLWQRKVTDYTVHQGYGSSPTVYGPLLIVSADNKGGGAIVAFDRATGEEVWRFGRVSMPNYASPIILTADGREQLVFTGTERVTSLDPMTGEKLWEVDGSTTETVTSPLTDGERIFISGGYSRNHVEAMRADGSGKLEWEKQIRVYVPSMVMRDGHLYAVTDPGVVNCWNCETGAELWKERLGGTFTASLVRVGGHILATNEAGKSYVFEATPEKFTLVAESRLGDDVYATPTVAGDHIFMRVGYRGQGERREVLYCLGADD